MRPGNQCLASMARLSISGASRPLAFSPLLIPRIVVPAAVRQTRCASKLSKSKAKKQAKAKKDKLEKKILEKKKKQKEFANPDPAKFPQFSLCDAIRYLRAFEVGKRPSSITYSAYIRVRAAPSAPVVKNTIKLPYPVSQAFSFAVICPEDSDTARQALEFGAVAVGEERLFQKIRDGEVQFDKLFCDPSSENALKKANLGRILGPKGLMPSRKAGTVTSSIKKTLTSGTVTYRERGGVIKMPVGRLNYTPKQIADNLTTLVSSIKASCAKLDAKLVKTLREVVISSTHGPGFNLNAKFKPTDPNVRESDLTGPM